jgi:4-alpha-methyl-delta7-sterol-4alpha-methyl oxidase
MQLLTANFTEFQLATVVTFLLHETVFFLSGLPSLLFERFGLFAKYKIQVKILFFCSAGRVTCAVLMENYK